MTRALDARGPEARADVQLGAGALGVTRLAPGETGPNPAWDPSGRWCVATDGELLNRRALLAELSGWGNVPVAESSSALAACIFAENGFERGLTRLMGDVAFVAWDAQERRFWAARDRAGLRPLAWAQLADGTVLVASEPAALLAHPWVDRRLDPVAIGDLLTLGFTPAPRTLWRAIHKLAPGELLTESAQGTSVLRWWTDAGNPAGAGGARYRWARSAGFSVELAIQQRALVESALAVAVSGGVYSEALLASTAARRPAGSDARHGGPVLAFTLGFDGVDERPRARRIAANAHADHVEIVVSASMIPGLLDELGALGEPLLDASGPGWWLLARAAADRGADTLLSGLGGAELFGGSPASFAERVASVPGAGWLRRAAQASGLPSLASLADPWATRHLRRRAGPLGTAREEACPPELLALAAASPTDDPAGAALWFDRRLLAESGLSTVDRIASAHGLRAQAPYADAQLARLVASVPIAHLVQVRRHRGFFLDALSERLQEPPAPSRGMDLPIDAWLANDTLLRGVPESLEGLLPGDLVRAGLATAAPQRWSLVALAAWRRSNGV